MRTVRNTRRKLGHTPPPHPPTPKKMKEIKCQPVIFKVLTFERNCACNYEQAEVLAYKQEKLTASWVFGPVFWLAVAIHSHVLPSCVFWILYKWRRSFPFSSHFTGLWQTECTRKCAVHDCGDSGGFMSLLAECWAECLWMQHSLGVCASARGTQSGTWL